MGAEDFLHGQYAAVQYLPPEMVLWIAVDWDKGRQLAEYSSLVNIVTPLQLVGALLVGALLVGALLAGILVAGILVAGILVAGILVAGANSEPLSVSENVVFVGRQIAFVQDHAVGIEWLIHWRLGNHGFAFVDEYTSTVEDSCKHLH